MIVRASASARRDLANIWVHVALRDEPAADRLIDRIAAATNRLADFPESGPARPEIAADARSVTVGRYLVLYRVSGDAVEVVRVLHGAMDILNALGDGEE